MPSLELRRDRKTGEPIRKRLVSTEKAKKLNCLEIRAYDNKREVEKTGTDLVR